MGGSVLKSLQCYCIPLPHLGSSRHKSANPDSAQAACGMHLQDSPTRRCQTWRMPRLESRRDTRLVPTPAMRAISRLGETWLTPSLQRSQPSVAIPAHLAAEGCDSRLQRARPQPHAWGMREPCVTSCVTARVTARCEGQGLRDGRGGGGARNRLVKGDRDGLQVVSDAVVQADSCRVDAGPDRKLLHVHAWAGVVQGPALCQRNHLQHACQHGSGWTPGDASQPHACSDNTPWAKAAALECGAHRGAAVTAVASF